MTTPQYTPTVRYKESGPDKTLRLYLYKVVRINPTPDYRATTVSFDWKRYQKLLAEHGISAREFGKLVRASYAELWAEGGFSKTKSVSQQLWWHVVKKLREQ